MNYKNPFSKNSLSLFIAFVLLSNSVTTIAQSAAIDGYPSGTKISKGVFASLPNFGVYVKAPVFEVNYQVIGYTLKLADDEGNLKEIACQGSAFSSLAKKAISDYTKSGDVITIQNIRVKGEDGREIKLPALLYYIE